MTDKQLATDVMVDIETLDTTPNAVILSIGAVAFNRAGVIDTFYTNISLKDNLKHNRTISEDTFYWWMSQDKQAGKVLGENPTTMYLALHRFLEFMRSNGDIRKLRLWGNGAAFDNVILRDALSQITLGGAEVWKFYNDMCFRTYVKMNNIERVRPTVAHDALSDALAQTQSLLDHWKKEDDSNVNN